MKLSLCAMSIRVDKQSIGLFPFSSLVLTTTDPERVPSHFLSYDTSIRAVGLHNDLVELTHQMRTYEFAHSTLPSYSP